LPPPWGMARAERLTAVAQLALLTAAAVVSVEAAAVARRSPDFSFARTSGLAGTLELARRFHR
jgi:hypothetical protein